MPVKVTYENEEFKSPYLDEHSLSIFLEVQEAMNFVIHDYLFTNKRDGGGNILVYDMKLDLIYSVPNLYSAMANFILDRRKVAETDFRKIRSYEIILKG